MCEFIFFGWTLIFKSLWRLACMVLGIKTGANNRKGKLQVLAIEHGDDKQPLLICRKSESVANCDSNAVEEKNTHRSGPLRLYYSVKTGDLLISRNGPKIGDEEELLCEENGKTRETMEGVTDVVTTRKRSVIGVSSRSRRTQTSGRVRQSLLTQESGCQTNSEKTSTRRRESVSTSCASLPHSQSEVPGTRHCETNTVGTIDLKHFNDLRKSPEGNELYSKQSKNELSSLDLNFNGKQFTSNIDNQENIYIPKLRIKCNGIDTVYKCPNGRRCSDSCDRSSDFDIHEAPMYASCKGHIRSSLMSGNDETCSELYAPHLQRNGQPEVEPLYLRNELCAHALTYGELLTLTMHIREELKQLQGENELLHELNGSLCSRVYGQCSTSRDAEKSSLPSQHVSVDIENKTREDLISELLASIECNSRLKEHVEKMTVSILERNESILDISKK